MIFYVEKLLDMRGVENAREYLVKWEGHADCTWEPASSVPMGDLAGADFHNAQKVAFGHTPRKSDDFVLSQKDLAVAAAEVVEIQGQLKRLNEDRANVCQQMQCEEWNEETVTQMLNRFHEQLVRIDEELASSGDDLTYRLEVLQKVEGTFRAQEMAGRQRQALQQHKDALSAAEQQFRTAELQMQSAVQEANASKEQLRRLWTPLLQR